MKTQNSLSAVLHRSTNPQHVFRYLFHYLLKETARLGAQHIVRYQPLPLIRRLAPQHSRKGGPRVMASH